MQLTSGHACICHALVLITETAELKVENSTLTTPVLQVFIYQKMPRCRDTNCCSSERRGAVGKLIGSRSIDFPDLRRSRTCW
jgi:hypothetical protein